MKNNPIKRLVVHSSATKPSMTVDVSVIDRWHRRDGYLKVGYHYVILRDGTLQKGRPDSEVGAHVKNYNTGSLGICLVGGLNETTGKAENNYTEAQFETLKNLLNNLQAVHPQAEILGHRDLSPDKNKDGIIQRNEWLKECPCFDVRSWWKTQKET